MSTRFRTRPIKEDTREEVRKLEANLKAHAATAQKPRQVIDKLAECLENYNANVHRGIHALGDRVTTELEESRTAGIPQRRSR